MYQRKTFMSISIKSVTYLLILTFLIFFLLPANQLKSAEVLVLSTNFPGIEASAGENITFPLEVKNNSNYSQIINLEISSKPENWNINLKDRGRNIHQVFVDSNNYVTFDLIVNIPDEAEFGEYPLTVTVKSENGYTQDNLTLKIKVTDTRAGEDELTAKYSELKGSSDATFNFKVDLTNNGSAEQVYSLGAQVQNGWQVSFKPSYENQQVASIAVNSGETKSLDVSVKPPVNITAGEYIVPILAASPTSRLLEELKIIISGTYDMEFSTPSGRLNTDIIAGNEKKITCSLVNSGNVV